MITSNSSIDENRTSNSRFEQQPSDNKLNTSNITINDDASNQQPTTTNNLGNLGNELVSQTKRNPDTISENINPSVNVLMDAFIKHTSYIFKEADKDFLSASESGKIVVSCKSYLNSLLGDKVARRYIATTMLVVRNNYSELNQEKRSKIANFLNSYYHAYHKKEMVQDELKKLYSSGIRPL